MKEPVLRLRLVVLVCAILLMTCRGSALSETPGVTASTAYQVIAYNDLGMHCMDDDFSILALLPPFNVLHAQVILKGSVPVVLGSTSVRLTYSAMMDRDGSINRTSAPRPMKTNFWKYVLPLFGVSLPSDQGLAGAKMPGVDNTPRSFQTYDSTRHWFEAKGIPITPVDDELNWNPFSVMKVTARDNSGRSLSTIPVVLPVSSEFHCDVCHETGNDAASPGFHGVPAEKWSQKPDMNSRVRENVLTLHDALNATNLIGQTPVLCFRCHYSAALDLAGTGPTGEQINSQTGRPNSFTSHAMHRHHGSPQLSGIPIPDEGINTCYYCHPGTQTKCLRGTMATAGMVCQSCHGGLPAVANTNRAPWKDLPKCQSCHTGDARHNAGRQIIRRIAYEDGPDIATPLIPDNKRFAENADPANPGKYLLYRNSLGHPSKSGHQSLACPACHGSPHAEWPVGNPRSNDNMAPKQLQGYAGTITECTTCHGVGYTPPSDKLLLGPHGMHSVNDSNWWSVGSYNHKYYIYQDNNPSKVASRLKNCQSCHGLLLEGTVLSRTSTDRVFGTGPMMNQITLKQGTPIHCGLCHSPPAVN